MTKPCDACQSGNAVIYCRADTAYLCSCCDSKVHGANKLASRHERVLVCDVCEHAPAAVTCKADAAALCVNCDADIHSANPLARRHDRVPVTPFYDLSDMKFNAEEQQCSLLIKEDEEEEESSAAEAASWLLPHPNKVSAGEDGEDDEDLAAEVVKVEDDSTSDAAAATAAAVADTDFSPKSTAASVVVKDNKFIKSSQQQQQNFDLFSDVDDPYLDMDFVSALGALHPVSDSLVPIQVLGESSPVTSNSSDSYDMELQEHKPGHNFCAELSLSTSSIDVGVVPDGSMSDISTPHSRPTCLLDFSQHHQQRPAPLHHATPLEPMAREARVLRYREKRKNRKFEKTIRYASRKAYAETRPRIKGRFAKRTELEVEHMYAVVPESAFGVVTSF